MDILKEINRIKPAHLYIGTFIWLILVFFIFYLRIENIFIRNILYIILGIPLFILIIVAIIWMILRLWNVLVLEGFKNVRKGTKQLKNKEGGFLDS